MCALFLFPSRNGMSWMGGYLSSMKSKQVHIKNSSVCVCVRVCVCERERERERGCEPQMMSDAF